MRIRNSQQRRAGYTLIELLVSMALIMTIMSILSLAFVEGLKVFGSLRATADMAQRLRTVAGSFRKDVGDYHFDGAIRPSDPGFGTTVVPREGFIRIYQSGPSKLEGSDGYNPSYIANPTVSGALGHVLHLAVKRRGNRPEDFFVANVGAGTVLTPTTAATLDPTTFFGQPLDARYQTLGSTQYSSQWAEVMYYLSPIGSTTNPTAPGGAQNLYGLYRVQRLVVANNTTLGTTTQAAYPSMSINPSTGSNPGNFNTSASLTVTSNRSLDPTQPSTWPSPSLDTLLVGNVISFTVRPILGGGAGMPAASDVASPGYDSASPLAPLFGVEISIRVWDLKSQQARQITIIQDL